MPFERIDLRTRSINMENAVCRCVDALRSGKILVLPTETVYGLAVRASDASAVQRLIDLKQRPEGNPFALAFSGLRQVEDFVPEMSDLALRLARRCWPGPVSLVLNVSDRGSEFHKLPEKVRQAVSQNLSVCFRVPDHALTSTLLGELNEPIVLTSVNRSGKPPMESPDEIIADCGAEIDLIADDGPLSGGKPSTVLRIDEEHYTVLRAGAVSEHTLDRLTARMILFVCTGNTCRSPMAERICEKLLARRLDCSIDQLEKHGVVVLSAGLAAGHEVPASHHAVEVLRGRDLDLTDHRSQMLNETHVRFADHIFAMTRNHREAILSRWPGADTRLSVLRCDGGDISDPIGGSLSIYQACAEQMEREIERRLEEIIS